ncbi:heat-shock protein HspR [Mangrovactinospora gilvigrisea]|uniref:Heat-shock protein HspR n=1 Tax=Mangrovactinospora gilvigrisea TaxID=1428644 RepID=A0A1J7BSW8_9ACTN|nr:helix-turn-helix transcriptional regulator [Mangrovactinospora gilvigrisea]OIV36561.1 heat-shock protein HspR [Mangrovactinospora gilvigrisea]
MAGRQPGSGGAGFPLDEDAPVYVISVAAQLSGLHPQTLRQYDRLGLVSPDRAAGRGRRYSARDIAQLRQVQQLSQEDGVNLAGIKRIIELENQVAALRARVAELEATMDAAAAAAGMRARPVAPQPTSSPLGDGNLLPVRQVRQSSAVVVWRQGRR